MFLDCVNYLRILKSHILKSSYYDKEWKRIGKTLTLILKFYVEYDLRVRVSISLEFKLSIERISIY